MNCKSAVFPHAMNLNSDLRKKKIHMTLIQGDLSALCDTTLEDVSIYGKYMRLINYI